MSVRVNGIDWNVTEESQKLATSNIIGLTDFEQCNIEIKRGLDQQRAEQVFFHELLHILLVDEEFTHDVETVVSRVSQTLYGTLVDNDLLVNGWLDRMIDNTEEKLEVDSKRVIVDHDPSQSDEPFRFGDYAEEIPASGRDLVD